MRKIYLLTIIMAAWMAITLTSCEKQQQVSWQKIEIDSLINAAYKTHDYEGLLALVNQLEPTHALADMKAYYWRGYAYSRLRKTRSAEIEWSKAVSLTINDEEDMEYYSKSANRLAGLLYMKFDYEGTIRTATSAIKVMQANNHTKNTDYANLQTFIGNCQLKLGHQQEAAEKYALAYELYQQIIGKDNDIANYTSSIIGIIAITDAYILAADYENADIWTQRLDSMLQRYRQQPHANAAFVDKQWARLHFYRGCALEGLGRKDEALRAYQTAISTNYAKTNDGQIEATNYLITARRWNEAADKLQVLEEQLRRYDTKMTLDNIQTYLLPKYRANVGAHRIDTAIAVGTWICNALDSAIVWEKQDAAVELATIYDTQQKESLIREQKDNLTRQRFIGAIIALVSIIIGFVLFSYFRHQSAMRLEAAYHHLEIANARAEESSRMKTNFIQQISHEIRTPLNILSGFTQVITTPGIELDEVTRADINKKITENTNRITSLVNKMLELSEANSRTVLECNDHVSAIQIAAEATDASGITTAKHLSFDLQLSPDAETVMLQTNQRAAVRALSLILDNARKFTAPAEARTHDKSNSTLQHAMLLITANSQQVTFTVEDTGIGIPPNEAKRIFDEFVQLDEYYDGTGIGLTVARSLARRLGGDLYLDTTYTAGARFVLTLPITTKA